MANISGTWDLPSLNYSNPNVGSSINNFNSMPAYNNSSMLNTPLGRVYSSAPPPVPARPVRSTYNTGFGSYSSPFNRFGDYFPSYGGYGGYGGYGFNSYRPGFNSYGCYGSSYPENRFIQLAEESSRPFLQSVQSVLHAFSSLTMMFESSFHAIYSSYMSVLGVADNFGKLRQVFGQIFSTFALLKSLNWLYRRILYVLGINKENFTKETIWSDALNGVSDINSETSTKRKKIWPTMLFMSIIMGGPYILFKLMSELYPNPVREIWTPAEHPGSLAVGLYDFHAASDQELSFTTQQKLMIAPKKYQPQDCPGWLLACNESRKTGLVPNNYVGIIMKSEKSGQTFINHNGQTYQHPGQMMGNLANSFQNHQCDDGLKSDENEKVNTCSEVKSED